MKVKATTIAAALIVAGCASQAERDAAAAQAKAEWETCADGFMVVSWVLMRASEGRDATSTLARATVDAMAQECGTGGLSKEDRALHILNAMLAINEDPAAFVKDYEARKDG